MFLLNEMNEWVEAINIVSIIVSDFTAVPYMDRYTIIF